jgi:hypothetical protein
MGGKSKSKSMQTSVSGPSAQQTIASNLLLEAIRPGSTGLGGYLTTGDTKQTPQQMQTQTGLPFEGRVNPIEGGQPIAMRQTDAPKEGYGVGQGRDILKSYLDAGAPYQSVLPGATAADGVRAPDARGIDTSQNYSTLLPSFDDAKYTDFFEKYDAGQLSTSAQSIVDSVMPIVENPISASKEQMNEIFEMAGANEVLTLPDPTPLTGVVSEIMQNSPAPMVTFIDNVLGAGTDAAIAQELDNLSTELMAIGQEQAKDMMDATLGQMAQQGIASSGAALAAIQDGLVDIAKNYNAQIAQARVEALGTLTQARGLGVSIISDLFQRGEQQQAMQLSRELKLLEVEAAKQAAKIQSHTQVQMQLNQAQQNAMALVIDEQRQIEGNKERTQQFIFNLLGQLATAGPGSSYSYGKSRSSSFNFGGNLSASISTAALFGGGGGGAAGAAAVGTMSDRRLKEDISLIGQSPSGLNIYKFKYKNQDGYYQGVMADEVPHASTMVNGYAVVNYSLVDVDFVKLGE